MSKKFQELLTKNWFETFDRGDIKIKGKGSMHTFFLEGLTAQGRTRLKIPKIDKRRPVEAQGDDYFSQLIAGGSQRPNIDEDDLPEELAPRKAKTVGGGVQHRRLRTPLARMFNSNSDAKTRLLTTSHQPQACHKRTGTSINDEDLSPDDALA